MLSSTEMVGGREECSALLNGANLFQRGASKRIDSHGPDWPSGLT